MSLRWRTWDLGTQFVDADLDGHYELFVANGHIDDYRDKGRAYAMRPQMFRWLNNRFWESDPASLGDYFTSNWLGRAVARIDWNRDGLEDLLVGHLEAESVLPHQSFYPSGQTTLP